VKGWKKGIVLETVGRVGLGGGVGEGKGRDEWEGLYVGGNMKRGKG